MHLKKCLAVLVLSGAFASGQPPLRQDTSPVVMTVDGKNVTAAEVQKILDIGEPAFLEAYRQNPQAALMNWYVIQHLGREAERLKLDQVSPQKEQLEAIRLKILAGAALNQELNGYPVSDQMIESYFATRRARYEESKIKAIYIAFKPGAAAAATGTSVEALQRAAQEAVAAGTSERTEAQAAARAADVVRQLRGGADFAKLVETYSDDGPSKSKGGDFGVVKAASNYPEDFRRTVMALEKGAISDPIRQATGFYIVRIEEKGVPPLAEVRAEISEAIRQDHLAEWAQGLNGRFNPVIKDPSFFAPKQQPAFTLPGR